MNSMKNWKLSVCLTTLILGLGLAASAAFAQDLTEQDKEVWQQRYLEIITRVRDAQDRLIAGKGAYSKARQRERLKGANKAEIMEQISTAEADLEKAQKELEEFPEEARQAGVPPGWLRDVEDHLGVASPSP